MFVQLWKRSGSWLNKNYSTPNVSIPIEDLEEIQQQVRSVSKCSREG